jgi:hypothetical protein
MFVLIATSWSDNNGNGVADVVEAAKPVYIHDSRYKIPVEEKNQGLLNDINMEKLRRLKIEQNVKNVFTSKPWSISPPVTKAMTQSSPATPPLPFTYLGKLIDQDTRMVFISKLDRNYVIKVGDVIDGTYRVDEINGSLMNLTYIPLNIKQTMQIGESN